MIHAKHAEIGLADRELQHSRSFARGIFTVALLVTAFIAWTVSADVSQILIGATPEPFSVFASLP